MLTDLLLPPIPDLHLLSITADGLALSVHLAATAAAAACPRCAQDSTRAHSSYTRHPADLPWAGLRVRYTLQVRRFFCDNPVCPRRIFAERFGPALRSYARRTTRLADQLQQLGLTSGGVAGSLLAALLGMPTSPSTVLRLVRQTALPPIAPPRVVGIDDFVRPVLSKQAYPWG